MTIENTVYEPAWICCALCRVKQPAHSLEFRTGWCCKDVDRCKRYQLELANECVAAASADPVLFSPSSAADKLLSAVHEAEPFKTVTTYAFPPSTRK